MKADKSSRTPTGEEGVWLGIPIPVESSWIASVAYHAETSVLDVELRSGAIYQFVRVPLQVFQSLLQAESLGEYFNCHIRGQFQHALRRSA
jgi:KTSC domain